MPQIIDTGPGRLVVVERERAVGSVQVRQQAVQVTSPGPQGPAGAPGGTSVPMTASATVGGHRIVRSTGAGLVAHATNVTEAHGDDVVGMTLGAATAGTAVAVQRSGSVSFNGWSWTPLEPVFLGVDGLLTQTPPVAEAGAAFALCIGHAEAPDRVFLNPQPTIYL